MTDGLPENTRVLRLFAAQPEALASVTEQVRASRDLECESMTKGRETLIVLQAKAVSAAANRLLLDHSTELVQKVCGGALYGLDAEKLPQAAVQALKSAGQTFAAADEATGMLLEKRLQDVPDADAVYDYGQRSYADERFGAKIAAGGALGKKGDAYLAVQGRIQEAYHCSGADYAVCCAPQAGGCILLVGQKKGLWQCVLPASENAGLWLMDILRRAADELPQAEETVWYAYGRAELPEGGWTEKEPAARAEAPAHAKASAVPAAKPDAVPAAPAPDTVPEPEQEQPDDDPEEETSAGDGRRREGRAPHSAAAVLLAALIVVAVIAVAALLLAGALSGGDIRALWERSGLRQFNVSGASLL